MTTYNTEHYAALITRLGNEKEYLSVAKSADEKELRSIWIKQIEEEIADEEEFLKSKGINVYSISSDVDDISEDDLMKELLG